MGWVTGGEVLQAVADTIKRDIGDLPEGVDRFVTQAVEKTKAQFRSALYARGYTEAQIVGSDQLQSLSYDQALFNVEVYLREIFQDRLGQLMALKNRLPELDLVVLTANDVVVDRSAANSGVLKVREDFDAAVRRADRRRGRWCGETYQW
jgi:hypothetical protein